jgi:hydroxyacylglutathione hydrolase
MTLTPLPAFDDNYIWMLHNGRDALVVDPGDAQPVLDALQRHHLTLRSILVTHHHADHVGGIHVLRNATQASVWGPANETLPEPLHRLHEGDTPDTAATLGLPFQVLEVPGHTAGHIAFYCADHDGAQPLLFCGDTLFSAGCGRLFEGSPAQMLASLERLAHLPDNTLVCCAHEYTLSNLKFALAVDPDNPTLIQYEQKCQALRQQGLPTLPSTIACERAINPFLRSHQPALRAAAMQHDAAATQQLDTFATLRQWKNNYR